MKRIITLSLGLILSTLTQAQINSVVSSQDASCWYTSDGSYTVDSIEACFAPIDVTIDSVTYTFNQLKNDDYLNLNHGAGQGEDRAFSVWAGQSPIGPVYIATGTYANSVTFDTISFTAQSDLEMFTVCYSANTGNVIWAINGYTSGAFNYTAGYAITGSSEKTFVTGYFNGNCQIGNSSITSPSGDYQAYIAKIDIATGNVDTIRQFGDDDIQEGYSINYADGRVYVGVNFEDTTIVAGNTFVSQGNLDGFVACIDTNMVTEYWAAQSSGSSDVRMTDIVAYSNGTSVEKVFVTGEFVGSATFQTNSVTGNGNEDFFVAAVDSSGNWIWSEGGGSPSSDYCTGIDINSSGDRLYLAGSFASSMIFGSQVYTASVSDDGFIAYMDTAGVLDTVYVFSGTGPDFIQDVQSVDDDYLIFTGEFFADLDYGDSTYNSNGQGDAFIGKIGPGQHEIWGKNFGGSQNDQLPSIHLGPNDRYHVAGFFQQDASAYQQGLISAGGFDVVVSNDFISGMIDTTITVSGLTAGTYYINYNDSNGNTVNDTVVIGPDSMMISGVVTNATSPTNNDGAIDLSVMGGTPGYSYLWSNGATTEDLDSIVAGNYCLTVTDNNGCMDSTCFFVDSSFVAGPLMVSGMVTNLNCYDDGSGAIDLMVSGGVTPYSFSWSNGATTEDLTNIAAGTYTVTVSDDDTSVVVDSFVVNQPLEIIVSGVITPPTTGTSNDGAVDLSVSGGLAPYSFNWSNGATTEDIDSLDIGNYSVTVTDSSGCEVVTTFNVDTIPALSLVSVSGDVTCLNSNNGSIDLTVIGGSAPFSYAWSNGAITEDIFGLSAGVYTVTVTDSVNQTAILTDTVGSNPIFPDPTVGPITGSPSVQAWTNYNYSVPVSSGSSFDWNATGGSVQNVASNAATVQWFAGPTGMLYVSETDANGCTGDDSLQVEIIFVGTEELHENAIAIFPNPARDQINLIFPSDMSFPLIKIYDLQGRLMLQERSRSYTSSLNVAFVPAGLFVVELIYEQEGIRLQHQMIKE